MTISVSWRYKYYRDQWWNDWRGMKIRWTDRTFWCDRRWTKMDLLRDRDVPGGGSFLYITDSIKNQRFTEGDWLFILLRDWGAFTNRIYYYLDRRMPRWYYREEPWQWKGSLLAEFCFIYWDD